MLSEIILLGLIIMHFLYIYLHSTGCPTKKFTQSLVKSDLAQWKINIFERLKKQKNRADSAVFWILNRSKTLIFRGVYDHFSDRSKFFWGHQVLEVLYLQYHNSKYTNSSFFCWSSNITRHILTRILIGEQFFSCEFLHGWIK